MAWDPTPLTGGDVVFAGIVLEGAWLLAIGVLLIAVAVGVLRGRW